MTSMTVNGKPVRFLLEPDTPLLWALRDAANLTGTKYGCGEGDCGACMVHVDGEALRSCLITIAEAEGRFITTIEGLPVRGDVTVKPLMSGDRMVMLEVHYSAGSASPVHVHRHESLCYVISGRIRGTIEGESVILGPGDACRHPEGVEHSVEALEDALILEIKSPAQPLDQFLGPR